MIGFYDYTVILTYVSLASSVIGMTQAIHGRFKAAVVLLAFSGLCDKMCIRDRSGVTATNTRTTT